MMTDPVADMLTRLRNALRASHDRVEFPASKLKAGICKVLKEEGFIKSFKIIAKSQSDVKIRVLFKDKKSIVGLQRFSKPGLRQYRGYEDFPRVLSGLGVSILSTSKGILSSKAAKRAKVGGEILCNVW